MGVVERRILWHPRGENKFVVGSGSQITLYEWASAASEIRHISSQHDLQFMKCLAWSPDPLIDDLLAVGLGSGRVDLLRLEVPRNADRNNVLASTSPIVSLPVLKSRACNSVHFCNTDPNLLAVGLDKVRGEGSLMVWDINTASTSFTSALGLTGLDGLAVPSPAQKKVTHQIPKGDVGPRTDERVLQQHAPTETVSSVAFLRHSSHLLLAGISYRWLRLFDLRSPVPATTNAASKIHGISTDPLDNNRIASFGDGVVTIWDARKLPQPILTFCEKDAAGDGSYLHPHSSYAKVEFSGTRRGTLAVLEKDAPHVRFWNLMESQPQPVDLATLGRPRAPSSSGRTPRKTWANLAWGGTASPERLSIPTPEFSPIVLSDTRKTKNFGKSLVSFALVPGSTKHPMTSDVMVVHQDGDLELYPVYDTPKQLNWSARGDFSMGACTSYRIFPGFQPSNDKQIIPWDSVKLKTPLSGRPLELLQEEDDNGTARATPPVLFGRGDKEGFPALMTKSQPTSPLVVDTQYQQQQQQQRLNSRVYSPSGMRLLNLALDNPESGPQTIRVNPSRDDTYTGVRERSRVVKHDRSSSSSKARHGRQQLKNVMQIVQGDISMTMRRRATEGYGLSNPLHNALVTKEEDNSLPDLWNWISEASDFLCHPISRINGYEFVHIGVLGIWEGFDAMTATQNMGYTALNTPQQQRPLLDIPVGRHTSRHGHERQSSRRSHSPTNEVEENLHAALVALASRKGSNRGWKPPTSTGRIVQRQVALQLCGWNLMEEGLFEDIKRWEKEGKLSRAACWLVFTKHYSKAIELLMRSEEETHQMMSGTLAALTSSSSSKNSDLKEHCERLIVRLQDPYFRAMLTQLTSGEWTQILEEEEILPLRERLAIALQFLDDKSLSSYLRRSIERACDGGHIDALVMTGLTKRGLDVLQGYVDHTGDVQTAAILGSFVHPTRLQDRRVSHWVDSYRDLLDGMKLFHHRVGFDIERGQIMNDAMHNGDIPVKEWVPKQIIIRCNYCGKPVVSDKDSTSIPQGQRPTVCQNCNRSLPRCSVCLMVLHITPDNAREAELMRSPHKDTIDDAIVTCQTCRHAGHASHILEWFFGPKSHGICPVSNCDCRCADEF